MAENIKQGNSPAWKWLVATVFLFPVLPEYISPFILFAGFIVFKRQWSKEGRKAKVGTVGKVVMVFMTFSLISVLWSDTKLDTLGSIGLWWAVFLILVMIYNLADTKEKIDEIIKYAVLSGALNGLLGTLQICTHVLNRYGCLSEKLVVTTPFYKGLDKAVYTWLPFKINTNTFSDRASGFFSNPNLLTSYMMFAYPLSIYLYVNAKSKKERVFYFFINLFISAGISSTMTRAGCVIALAGWVFMFAVLIKRHSKKLLLTFIPTVAIIIPSILTRYGLIFTGPNNGGDASGAVTAAPNLGSEVAQESTANHFIIWDSVMDYISESVKVFLIGLGFGCESTGIFLEEIYGLKKPHAHNFILEIWAETGIIGIAMFIAAVAVCCVILFRTKNPQGIRYSLVFYIFTSLMLFLGFGLTDYIFNSPKQIIILMILFGLVQAVSSCYEDNGYTRTENLKEYAKKAKSSKIAEMV